MRKIAKQRNARKDFQEYLEDEIEMNDAWVLSLLEQMNDVLGVDMYAEQLATARGKLQAFQETLIYFNVIFDFYPTDTELIESEIEAVSVLLEAEKKRGAESLYYQGQLSALKKLLDRFKNADIKQVSEG
jgi:hypothetical protein